MQAADKQMPIGRVYSTFRLLPWLPYYAQRCWGQLWTHLLGPVRRSREACLMPSRAHMAVASFLPSQDSPRCVPALPHSSIFLSWDAFEPHPSLRTSAGAPTGKLPLTVVAFSSLSFLFTPEVLLSASLIWPIPVLYRYLLYATIYHYLTFGFCVLSSKGSGELLEAMASESLKPVLQLEQSWAYSCNSSTNSICNMPSTVLGAGRSAVNKTD